MKDALEVHTATGRNLFMKKMSSLKFSKLFLKSYIPDYCKLYSLELNKASMDLYEVAENFIQLITENISFIVVGWYKRGQIANKSLISTRSTNSANGGKMMENGGNNNN